HRVRIQYRPGSLDLYMDDQRVLSGFNVNLATLGVLDSSGKAFVGFTAATGGQGEEHDVLSWTLSAGGMIDPPSSEFANIRLPDVDPVLTIPDAALRGAIARGLGQPVTASPAGTQVTHEPIYASAMAELQQLDLSGLGITNLSALQFATNLQAIDLSNNPLASGDLSLLAPHPEAGAPV